MITTEICRHIDGRVIWGGDRTVSHIRSIATPPHCLDFPFPNKWSLSFIACDYWNSLGISGKYTLETQFANDAFQFGQAACSSPRAWVWLNTEKCPFNPSEFWGLVAHQIDGVFKFSDVDYANKLVAGDLIATQAESTRRVQGTDNRITHLTFDINELSLIVNSDVQCDGGFFSRRTSLTLVDYLMGLVARFKRSVMLEFAGINSWNSCILKVPLEWTGLSRLVKH